MTADINEVNDKLSSLLAQLQATPPPAPSPRPPVPPGPRTREEHDVLCVAILTDQDGSPESIAAATAAVAEIHRRTAALEAELSEKRKTTPATRAGAGSEPEPRQFTHACAE